MLLVLDLVPGSSVGPFTLGMPLSTAVKYVRDKKSEYRCVEVKYADQALFDHDLILNFPEHGMHLRFEPCSQRLRLIEIYDVSRMQLRYGRGALGGASHSATALLVYELMGPTYPGRYEPASRMYHLHYPGLLFLFPIPPQHAQHCLDHATELHLEFPDDTTPVASRICIHSGTAETPQEVAEASPPPPLKGSPIQPVIATLGKGVSFSLGSQSVSFGDSPQDVCSTLGSPSSTLQRPADPAARQSPHKQSSALDYFYSYAHRGIDVLFDGRTHRVNKFVLRTNAPGHSEFNSYSKCNFSLNLTPKSASSPAHSRPSSEELPSPQRTPGKQSGVDQAQRDEHIHANGRAMSDISSQDIPPAREPDLVSPTSSLQDAMQGALKDMFASPRTPLHATPTKERQSDGEGSAWEKATEWSKSLLDMSARPFTFSGDSNTGSHPSPDAEERAEPHSGASLNQGLTEGLETSDRTQENEDIEGAEGFRDGLQLDDQRDGWDDADSALLGLELPKSEPSVPEVDLDDAGTQASEPAGGIAAFSSRGPDGTDPPVSLQLPEHTCDDQVDLEEQGAVPASDLARIEITCDSHFEDIQAVMGDAGIATIHTRGLGSNPFARTHVHGYKGVAFEIMRNGYMASMTLFRV